MTISVFAVFDSKAESFFPPVYFRNAALAIRAFEVGVSDKEHDFYKHAEDYTLFELGTYEDANGSFELFDAPKSIVGAYALKATLAKRAEGN